MISANLSINVDLLPFQVVDAYIELFNNACLNFLTYVSSLSH